MIPLTCRFLWAAGCGYAAWISGVNGKDPYDWFSLHLNIDQVAILAISKQNPSLNEQILVFVTRELDQFFRLFERDRPKRVCKFVDSPEIKQEWRMNVAFDEL